MSNGSALRPGFLAPVADSQQVFRRVLRAMSEPGSLQDIAVDLAPPAPLDRATAALCLTLLDFETPVWLDAAADGEEVRGRAHLIVTVPLYMRWEPWRVQEMPLPRRRTSDMGNER